MTSRPATLCFFLVLAAALLVSSKPLSASIVVDPDGDSHINLATGGMLALRGDAADSIGDFLALAVGTDAIHYWDDAASNWADITAATPGEDYTLTYSDAGEWAGYTILTVGTVPEPGAVALLLTAWAGLLFVGRRETSRTR